MWPPPDAAGPPPAACAAAIRGVDGTASAASVPAGCWRVGPLVLGMSRADVQGRLGAPDAGFPLTGDDHSRRRYDAAVYLFPRGLQARLERRAATRPPSLAVLGLLYLSGRLARIEVQPGLGVAGGRCADGRSPPRGDGPTDDRPPPDFLAVARFASVRIGEPVSDAVQAIGRPASMNRSHDFRAYDPAPITLGGEKRLVGFSISADRLAQFDGFEVRAELHRRLGDCRIDGLALRAPSS